MVPDPVRNEASGGEIEQFKEALVADKNRQLDEIREKTEHEISELIVEKRLSVEKQVAELREKQKEKYNYLARQEDSEVQMKSIEEIEKYLSVIFQELEKQILESFKWIISDHDRYSRLMNNLCFEAMEMIEGPVTVQVETGHSEFLAANPRIIGITERKTDFYGGCLVLSEDGRLLIDNTLRIRWKRIKPEYIRRISIQIIEKVSEIPDFFG